MLDIKYIEGLMEQRKLSKKEVLFRCGITRPTLDKILRGGDINVSTLLAIANGLNVKASELLGEAIGNTASGGIVAFAGNNSGNINTCSSDGQRIEELKGTIEQLKSQLNDKDTIISLLRKNNRP